MSESLSELNAAAIQSYLPQALQNLITNYHIFPQLASTSEWLLQQQVCQQLCLAEQQTAARGRRGRTWHAPAGNVYFSLRWCFEAVPAHYGWLSLVAGVAIAKGLQDYGLTNHKIKWPNDIYHNNRKLCGILLQTATPLQQVVVSFGLNANMSPEHLDNDAATTQPWCDLASILGQTVDRNRLIAVILTHLLPALQDFLKFDHKAFLNEWQPWDLLENCRVAINTGTEKVEGVVHGLDKQGRLQVMLPDHSIQTYSSADISVRKQS